MTPLRRFASPLRGLRWPPGEAGSAVTWVGRAWTWPVLENTHV
jgi:hypothetical protein